jgi:hypothetical protein
MGRCTIMLLAAVLTLGYLKTAPPYEGGSSSKYILLKWNSKGVALVEEVSRLNTDIKDWSVYLSSNLYTSIKQVTEPSGQSGCSPQIVLSQSGCSSHAVMSSSLAVITEHTLLMYETCRAGKFLRQTPDSPSPPYYLTSPCAQLQAIDINTRWFITVHSSFIVNVTVLEAYVPYTDHGHDHHVDIMEAHAQNFTTVERLCGYSLQQVVYSNNEQVVVAITSTSSATLGIYLKAVYQVHIKGYVCTFANSDLVPFPSAWNITMQTDAAFSITYIKGFYHLTWLFTKGELQYQTCHKFKKRKLKSKIIVYSEQVKLGAKQN